MSPELVQAIRERLAQLPDPALDDPDNPEWTDEDFARATRFDPPIPASQLTEEVLAKVRGRPKSVAPKVATKLRIDSDVLAAFKAEGPGWQTRMNAALRAAMPKPAAA